MFPHCRKRKGGSCVCIHVYPVFGGELVGFASGIISVLRLSQHEKVSCVICLYTVWLLRGLFYVQWNTSVLSNLVWIHKRISIYCTFKWTQTHFLFSFVFYVLFVSWGAAVVSGCRGVKVTPTACPSFCAATVSFLCQFSPQHRPAGASQQPAWPQAWLWWHTAWRRPFPTQYRHRFGPRRHMFCHPLSCIEGKGEGCPAVSSWQSAPPHQSIAHTMTHFLVGC